MQQYKLGEICTIIKGTTGIKKAIPGEYPLVVTAENRLSSNEFQFDAKAVCIPLVSSTGHGHASLKRLHYQEGKFALGNILAAVIPNDENLLNAEYLYYYLTFYKDSKIVPLMKGAANVSLTINSIKTITIEIPKIEQQVKVVNTIKKSQIELKKINQKYQEQNNYITDLRTSILQYAVQGKLVEQNPQDEPASELLKRIKAEKEQLIKEGKIKKEKTLPPITQDEIPYDLPQGWKWVRLGELGITTTGTTPSTNKPEFFGGKYSFVKPADITNSGEIIYNKQTLSDLGIKNGRFIPKNSILMVCIGGSIGKVGFTKKDCSCNQQINAITPYIEELADYIFIALISPFFYNKVLSVAPKTTLPIISKGKWESLILPLPPLAEQKRIVAKVDKLMQLCEELEIENNIALESSSELFQSIMQNYFTQKESSNKIIDLNFKRAVLSAKIINELYEEKYFGAVKLEKILYLCETHLGITLNGKYKKEAAGPYDAKSRYEVEDILKIKKWFDVQKVTNGSVEITKYLPLENCHEIKTLYNDVFAGSLSKIDKLMDLFKGKNSDFCESIATLYAVWKNRLNNNLTCSNSELIADFKMWCKSKERFYDSDLLDRILFMRRKGLTPDLNIKK